MAVTWKDVANALPQGLELLGGALSLIPGAGTIAGGAVSGLGALIGHALGTDATPDAIQATLTSGLTPEQKASLLQLQENNKAELQKITMQLQMAVITAKTTELQEQTKQDAQILADKQSARARQMEMRDQFPAILMICVTGGFFGLLALFVFHAAPAENKDILYAMTGALGTAWISGMAYYFGSSRGSDMKNFMLDKVQDTLSTHLGNVTAMLGSTTPAVTPSATEVHREVR